MSLVATVKRARKTAGLSLTEVAERSGLQLSNLSAIEAGKREPRAETLDRVAHATRRQFVAVPHVGMTAAEAAEEIYVAIQRGFESDLIRIAIQLNDNLVGAMGVTARYALVLETPDSTGRRVWDAVIAGIVEYRFKQFGFAAPDWVAATVLTDEVPFEALEWPSTALELRLDKSFWRTDEAFTRRGVFFAIDDLESI